MCLFVRFVSFPFSYHRTVCLVGFFVDLFLLPFQSLPLSTIPCWINLFCHACNDLKFTSVRQSNRYAMILSIQWLLNCSYYFAITFFQSSRYKKEEEAKKPLTFVDFVERKENVTSTSKRSTPSTGEIAVNWLRSTKELQSETCKIVAMNRRITYFTVSSWKCMLL